MAQYLPYIPEVFPDPVIYRPDFNFFDRMLQRKQGQFEQGLSQVKSAYSSILNAPLSDKANIPLRDQYLKQAQETLKNISSTDLSLPQNVEAAQNIFSPFWEDNMIVQDATLTKWYQNEASKLASWRDSPDDKVRSKYNGISMMYLNNGLSALQNANRNPEAYAKVEKRQAVPFTNIEQYLQEQATKEKLEIKYDDPSGPYLVETVNGERSQKKYSTWAQSVVGNNFYDQFRVTGIVEKEERAKALKRTNPNLSEEEIGTLIAKDVVSELEQGYTKRKSEVDVEIARIDSLLTSLRNTNNPANEQFFDKLLADRMNLIAKKEGINQEYKYFDQPSKDRIFSAVNTNPDAYFATLAKQRLIENWATGRASIESKVIKENTAYTSAENIRLRQLEYNLNVQKATWDRDQNLWERVNAKPGTTTTTKTSTLKDKDGNEVVLQEGQDKDKSLMYVGYSNIDVTRNEATALDLFNKTQKQTFMNAFNMVFDQKGVLSLAKNLGLDDSEIAHLATAYQKEIATDYQHKFTKEQLDAAKKLSAALTANEAVKKAGITKITGPGSARNALIAYAQDYFKQRLDLIKGGADIELSKEEREMLYRYDRSNALFKQYTANEENREKLVQENILTNKDFAPLVVERDGKKDLIRTSDLAKDMPTMVLRNKATREIRNLSKEDVATLFMAGKLTQTSQYELNIDGNNYYIDKVNNIEDSPFGPFFGPSASKEWNNIYNDTLVPKYGQSSEFHELLKKAQTSVVPDLLMYKDKSGKQGTSFTLTFIPNKTMGQGDKAATIMDQALNPANADIYDANGKPLEADKMEAVRAFLKSEKNVEDYIAATYIPQGVNGQRTIRFTFTKASTDGSDVVLGGNFSYKDLAQKTFDIVLKDGATAPALDDLPNNTGYQIHDALARGQVVKSDPVMSAAGFEYVLTPNVLASQGGPDEEPSYVNVSLKYLLRENVKDPKTGQMTSSVKMVSIPTTYFNLKGDNAKSPDEIVDYLDSLLHQSMMQNKQRYDEYMNYLKSSNGGTAPVDYDAKLKDAGLGNLIK